MDVFWLYAILWYMTGIICSGIIIMLDDDIREVKIPHVLITLLASIMGAGLIMVIIGYLLMKVDWDNIVLYTKQKHRY